MGTEQVDKIVAAILATEASRQKTAAGDTRSRDIPSDLWDYYTHFSTRLSDARHESQKGK
jgi:hypothetical protein